MDADTLNAMMRAAESEMDNKELDEIEYKNLFMEVWNAIFSSSDFQRKKNVEILSSLWGIRNAILFTRVFPASLEVIFKPHSKHND